MDFGLAPILTDMGTTVIAVACGAVAILAFQYTLSPHRHIRISKGERGRYRWQAYEGRTGDYLSGSRPYGFEFKYEAAADARDNVKGRLTIELLDVEDEV